MAEQETWVERSRPWHWIWADDGEKIYIRDAGSAHILARVSAIGRSDSEAAEIANAICDTANLRARLGALAAAAEDMVTARCDWCGECALCAALAALNESEEVSDGAV